MKEEHKKRDVSKSLKEGFLETKELIKESILFAGDREEAKSDSILLPESDTGLIRKKTREERILESDGATQVKKRMAARALKNMNPIERVNNYESILNRSGIPNCLARNRGLFS